MIHEIHRVTGFERIAPFVLCVAFEDETTQTIDFRPVLHGELFGPLQEQSLFDQVRVDEEAHTLVWPNGADFDPATLYNWPTAGPKLAELAKGWAVSAAN